MTSTNFKTQSLNILPYDMYDLSCQDACGSDTTIFSGSDYSISMTPNFTLTIYPGSSNPFSALTDTVNSIKTFYSSYKEGDFEGIKDSSVKLVAAPANVLNTSGTLFNNGIKLNLISIHKFSVLITFSYIFGIILCVIEGVLNFTAIFRQKKLKENFEFSLIRQFDKLLYDFHPIESPKALEKIIDELQKKPSILQKQFGLIQTKKILLTLHQINDKIKESPLYYRKVLRKYAPELRELSRHLLIKNLIKLQKTYFQLSLKEIDGISKELVKKNMRSNDMFKIKHQAALHIKMKALARRIRPMITSELSQCTIPLLIDLIKNNQVAIKNGITLIKHIDIQQKKQVFTNYIGLLGLVTASVSLFTMIAGFVGVFSYTCILMATLFALLQTFFYITTLDSKGYKCDLSKLVPNCLKSPKIHNQNLILSSCKMKVSLDQSKKKLIHSYRFNPFKSQKILTSN